jgi:hypothetical protein
MSCNGVNGEVSLSSGPELAVALLCLISGLIRVGLSPKSLLMEHQDKAIQIVAFSRTGLTDNY